MSRLMTAWAERREAREDADADLVWAWLDQNPNAPLGALHACIPLSGRRLRRALGQLQTEAEGWL